MEVDIRARVEAEVKAEMEAKMRNRLARAHKFGELEGRSKVEWKYRSASSEPDGYAGDSYSQRAPLLDLHHVAHLLAPSDIRSSAPRYTLAPPPESTHSMTTRSRGSSRNVSGTTTPVETGAKRSRDDDRV
jgi:hypothetical protein